MTVIYVPRLIESAEQAEALPADTIAKDGDLSVAVKAEDGHWARTDVADGLPMISSRSMVGWTALVPIEAEEEWAAEFESGEMCVNLDEDCARAADGGNAMSRLVTPWEEA